MEEERRSLHRGFNIERLTKTQQSYIRHIEQEIDYLRSEIRKFSGEEETKITINPYSDRKSQLFLNENTAVRFKLGDGSENYIDVKLDGRHNNLVRVASGRGLDLRPQASNVVLCRVGDLFL